MESNIEIVKNEVRELLKTNSKIENDSQFGFICGLAVRLLVNQSSFPDKIKQATKTNIMNMKYESAAQKKIKHLIKQNLDYVDNHQQIMKDMFSIILAWKNDKENNLVTKEYKDAFGYALVTDINNYLY